MTVFQLKEFASSSVHAAADVMGWNYDRTELIADGIIHAIGVLSGLIAATVLVVLTAIYADATDIVGVSIYVAGLLSMLVLSATYNLWPVSPAKWLLRRFDHSAIYLLIAATYTPFILEVKDSGFALVLLAGVWCVAILGIVLKLFYPGRFDRVSVGIYLAMGWSGVMLYDAVVRALPALVLGFILAGGAALQLWRDLPCLAAAAFPECDLARLCVGRRGVPLYRGARPHVELSKTQGVFQEAV
ncbi:hemolysin III [Bradyrhizobium ottawaense]